jgi:hypothetical protein
MTLDGRDALARVLFALGVGVHPAVCTVIVLVVMFIVVTVVVITVVEVPSAAEADDETAGTALLAMPNWGEYWYSPVASLMIWMP